MQDRFLEIVDAHQNIIFKVCRMYRDSKEDQEDLFQEIVLQLWKSFPSFRAESKISSWIYRVALNTAMAVYRKKKVTLDFKEDISENLYPRAITEPSENEQKMFDAFRKLDNAERAIIALYLEDYSYREIGGILGKTENYVGVLMSRIKQKLKIILG